MLIHESLEGYARESGTTGATVAARHQADKAGGQAVAPSDSGRNDREPFGGSLPSRLAARCGYSGLGDRATTQNLVRDGASLVRSVSRETHHGAARPPSVGPTSVSLFGEQRIALI